MLVIKRDYKRLYTQGEIILPNGEALFSLELPWLNNKRNVSCIPEGEYFFMRDTFGRHTYFKLLNVQGRSAIEIHPANNTGQLQGCIAPCLKISNGTAIASRSACEKLLSFYGDEDVKYLLRIEHV